MIRDPFGGWDFDGIKQLLFMIGMVFGIISFAAETSGNWYDPWQRISSFVYLHSTVFLILSMIALLGLFWHERFMGGLH